MTYEQGSTVKSGESIHRCYRLLSLNRTALTNLADPGKSIPERTRCASSWKYAPGLHQSRPPHAFVVCFVPSLSTHESYIPRAKPLCYTTTKRGHYHFGLLLSIFDLTCSVFFFSSSSTPSSLVGFLCVTNLSCLASATPSWPSPRRP